MEVPAPTPRQVAFARALQAELQLTNALLDAACIQRYRVPFAGLDRAQISDLIGMLQKWKQVKGMPDDLRRATGQADLPGFG